MQFNLKKEMPLIGIVLIPFAYLAIIWNALPQRVPIHWGSGGAIDRYGDKAESLLIPFLLPLLTYVIFTVVPAIDPKGKIGKMGSKLYGLKMMVAVITSGLAVFILYSMKDSTPRDSNYFILFIGVLYIIMGNYFKVVQPTIS